MRQPMPPIRDILRQRQKRNGNLVPLVNNSYWLYPIEKLLKPP